MAPIEKPEVFDARIVEPRCHPIQLAEHLDLEGQVLGHCFDDEVARRDVLERLREGQPLERGVGVGAGQLAPLDRPVEAVAPRGHVRATALECGCVRVGADGGEADRGEHLRDPTSHHAGAEHPDLTIRVLAHQVTSVVRSSVFHRIVESSSALERLDALGRGPEVSDQSSRRERDVDATAFGAHVVAPEVRLRGWIPAPVCASKRHP